MTLYNRGKTALFGVTAKQRAAAQARNPGTFEALAALAERNEQVAAGASGAGLQPLQAEAEASRSTC